MISIRNASALLLTSTLALSACGGNSSQNSSQTNNPAAAAAEARQKEVSFDLDLSAVLEKELTPGAFADPSSVANLLQGSMMVTDLASGGVEFYPWTVNIDESDLTNVQSFQTMVLEPGDYAFELAVSKAGHSYSGSTVYNLNDGDQGLVAMTIRPVIGDTLVDVNTAEELIDFRFSYSATEINSAGLTNPSMGITINGNAEQIFALNPATGISEHMLLNLQPGQYDISLRLLDSGIQVGKSIQAQESNISVAQGLDVTMDIVPLHGEIAFGLTAEGADATINLQVPTEVVEEVGSVANLQTIFSVSGANYPLHEQTVPLFSDASGYIGTVVLPDVFYGDMSFELTFTDNSDGEEIGYCVTSTVLTNASDSINCELTLRRRQIVSGNLMSALGINVRDVNGVATPGAVISIGDDEVAITNSAAFSTAGYSKVYVASGTHTIRAQQGAAFGEVDYTSQPLAVSNIDIVLDRFDTDGDGVEDSADACPTEPGNSATGCPSNLADDLLLSGLGNPSQIAVRLNDGTGNFTQVQENQQPNTAHAIAVGDFNQDGLDDVAAMQGGVVRVALGPFTGGISMVQVGTKTGTRPNGIAVGDFNNDDVQDLVVAADEHHSVFLGNGDGSFGAELTFPSLAIDNRSIAVGDFDQDGNLDITVNSNAGNCHLAIHYGDGTGNFPVSDTELFPNLLNLHVRTGDVDADGDLDILTAGYGYGVRVFTNNGNRNFAAGTEQFLQEVLVFGEDFNDDGAADLVMTNDSENALKVRLNDGAGGFGAATTIGPVPGFVRAGVSMDRNSDGKKDLAVTSHNAIDLTFAIGNGDGTFQTTETVAGIPGNVGIVSGKFD